MVALAMDPAREPNIRPLIREPQGAAGMGAIGVHEVFGGGALIWEARKGAWGVWVVKARAGVCEAPESAS
jgi:hypothetical protein